MANALEVLALPFSDPSTLLVLVAGTAADMVAQKSS
jgi:hypothetical protein